MFLIKILLFLLLLILVAVVGLVILVYSIVLFGYLKEKIDNYKLKGKYRYVWVNANLSVREVSVLERIYLQTKFPPGDGNRPYIKSSYLAVDGRGKQSGFCRRIKIPKEVEIKEFEKEISEQKILAEIEKMGYEVDLTGIYIGESK